MFSSLIHSLQLYCAHGSPTRTCVRASHTHKKKNSKYSGDFVPQQCLGAAHTLRSDKNTINSGHYILSAMPKGSTRTLLEPKNILAYIYHDVCSSLHPNVQPEPPVQADPTVKHVNPIRPTANSCFPLNDLLLIWIILAGN